MVQPWWWSTSLGMFFFFFFFFVVFVSVCVRLVWFFFCCLHLLCLLFVHSFISFDWIRNAISSDSSASQSAASPPMLKHLTERQKPNLIEQFRKREKSAQKKTHRLCGARLCVHMWNSLVHLIPHNDCCRCRCHWPNLSHCGNIS